MTQTKTGDCEAKLFHDENLHDQTIDTDQRL